MLVQKNMMYQKKPSINYQELASQYGSLVKRIAQHLLARLPDNVQLDDLVQSGMLGLFEAATNFDQSRGASFETYAGIRIRGSMLDEIRKGDWVPRSVHRNSRRISEAIRTVEMREGRDAQDQEIADYLELSLDQYYELLRDTHGSRLLSFEEILENTSSEHSTPQLDMRDCISPHMDTQNSQRQQQLIEALKSLPEREQLVLSLYYDDELNLKEIGLVLGVSESRVSQIHSQAALRLRSKMFHWQ